MASSSGNTPPFDFVNLLKSSSNPFPPTPASYPPPPTGPFQYNQQQHYAPSPVNQMQQHEVTSATNLQPQRSISFPTPPLNLQSPRDNNNPGTHILALLNNNNGGGGVKEPSRQLPVVNPHDVSRSFPGAMVLIRVPSCKIPRGRRLSGEHAVYDVDVRVQGEVKPQLEVTPITKYGSDPQLVVGRQIAVNKDYICYGLKGGNIRVLNINTALRSLFRGHSQRVTDMAFFAEDVHLLASVSLDGKVFVWQISEGPEGDDEPQITAKIVLALQILGEEDTKHPRVCWHCHKQENLVVSIGKHVLRIDTTKVGRGDVFSAEAPLQCPLDKLIDGVQIVGKHDGEVTDLSMCQWMTTRLVSASVDGTVKIWQDRKAQPVTVLRPHDGHPVNSATFVTSPERPGHITLITGGPLNRQMKIWASAGEEGCLQADAESWKCTQTLDLKSSTESRAEEAFFNQVIALSEAGLLLLANAKRNAIYAVHLDYGSSPVVTRMDYLSEFTVTMPILSFIGTNDPAIVKVYCVQTQAIQQYTLDLCLCLPPPIENVGLEKSDYSVSREANFVEGTSEQSGLKPTELPSVDSVPKPSILVNRSESADISSSSAGPASAETTSPSNIPSNPSNPSNGVPPDASNSGSVYAPSPPLPLSPRLSSKLSCYQTPVDAIEQVSPRLELGGKAPSVDYSVDRQRDTAGERNLDVSSFEENSRSQDKNVTLTPDDGVSEIQSPPAFFRHPTNVVTPHLVTPSEIFRSVSSTEACIIQDVNNDARGTEVEVKEVGEARSSQNGEINYYGESENRTPDNREKIFCSQASNLSIEMARDRHPITEKTFIPKGSKANGESLQPGDESGFDSRVLSARLLESVSSSGLPQSADTPSNVANLADSYNEHSQSSSHPMTVSQYLAMQEAINQIIVSQKEMQKQLSNAVNGSIKEGKRIELAVGRMMERSNKSNNDALWARFQEENVKKEKASHDHGQHIVNATTSFMSKELSAMCEKIIKKESAATIPLLARAVTPVFEKAVSSAITESLQRGIGDKAVNQLDKSVNSKLEATVTRQLQVQFQTSGRQALQDAVRTSIESSIVPSFERACKTMFDQVDSAFQKGMVEHTKATLQQYESVHSPLAHTLKEAITSGSSIAQALSRELAESQRNHRLALAAAGTNSGASNPLVTQLSNGPPGALLEKVEAPIDPTIELKRLISERKYDESFTSALQRSDVSIVSWLCSQVDLRGLMAMNPLPLSQGVLLSLLQQLACDIANDTSRKLTWMTDVVGAINPSDQMIAVHARPIFEQVYQILHHQRNAPNSDVSAIRLIMHVINSMLMGCK